jgi:hypothetical protein
MDDPASAELIERLELMVGLRIEAVTPWRRASTAAMHRLYGPQRPHDVDVFARRNVLISPMRDHAVAELVERGSTRRQRTIVRVNVPG